MVEERFDARTLLIVGRLGPEEMGIAGKDGQLVACFVSTVLVRSRLGKQGGARRGWAGRRWASVGHETGKDLKCGLVLMVEIGDGCEADDGKDGEFGSLGVGLRGGHGVGCMNVVDVDFLGLPDRQTRKLVCLPLDLLMPVGRGERSRDCCGDCIVRGLPVKEDGCGCVERGDGVGGVVADGGAFLEDGYDMRESLDQVWGVLQWVAGSRLGGVIRE